MHERGGLPYSEIGMLLLKGAFDLEEGRSIETERRLDCISSILMMIRLVQNLRALRQKVRKYGDGTFNFNKDYYKGLTNYKLVELFKTIKYQHSKMAIYYLRILSSVSPRLMHELADKEKDIHYTVHPYATMLLPLYEKKEGLCLMSHHNQDYKKRYRMPIDMIMGASDEYWVQKEINSLTRRVNKNYKEAMFYMDNLRIKSRRLYVIKIALFYVDGFSCPMDDMVEHREMMIKFINKNYRLSKYVVGYLWKVHYQLDHKVKIHFLLFLDFMDDLLRQNTSDELKSFWETNVTNSKGICLNSLYPLTGRIEDAVFFYGEAEVNPDINYLLDNTISFLIGSDFYIQPQFKNKKIRAFGRGLISKDKNYNLP